MAAGERVAGTASMTGSPPYRFGPPEKIPGQGSSASVPASCPHGAPPPTSPGLAAEWLSVKLPPPLSEQGEEAVAPGQRPALPGAGLSARVPPTLTGPMSGWL